MLSVEIGADIARLSSGLNQARSQVQGFAVSSSQALDKFAEKATSIGSKLGVVFSIPLGLLAKQAVKNAGDLESLTMGLKAVEEQQFGAGKSAEYAKLRLAEYIEVAKLPGLGLSEAIGASINLRSAGESAGNAKREILSFGNALALVGKGKAELSGVVAQLTQLINKQSGFGADLRIIREYAPQVGGALQKAFGTIDTEKIAKTGITGREVVAKIVAELEKLPKAGAGIKNTFENLSDSLFNSLARVGLSLDKAFDIKGNIEKFAGFIERAANAFNNLSPFAQKAISIVAGLLIILPPILIAFGQMLPALTAIGGVLAEITLPILAIGVAIGALAYVIYQNWDAIVQKLKDWGFLDQIKRTFNEWVGFLKAGFNAIKVIAGGVWSYFQDTLVPIWNTIFSAVVIAVRSAFGVLGGVFKFFKGVFTLSWTDMWGGFKDVVGNIFTGIIGIVAKAVGFLGILLGKFVKSISGNDTILKSMTDLSNYGFGYEKNSQEKTAPNIPKGTAPSGTTTNTKTTKELTEEQLNAIKAFNEKSQDLFDKANTLRNENYANSLKDELRKAIALEDAKYNSKRVEIQKEVASERSKNALLAQLEKEHQLNLDNIRKDKELKPLGIIGTFRGSIGSQLQGGADAFGKLGVVNSKDNLITGLVDKINAGIPKLLDAFSKVGFHVMDETEKLRRRTLLGFSKFDGNITEPMLNVFTNLNERLSEILQQGAITALQGIGDIAGKMITGSASFSDAGNLILGVIGSVFSQMGEQFLSAGVVLSGLSALLTNPFTSAGALIAVGLALSALGGAISSTVSSGGGGGSGVSASANRSGGNGYGASQSNISSQQMKLTINLSGELTARGNDLVYSINRTQKETIRTRG